MQYLLKWYTCGGPGQPMWMGLGSLVYPSPLHAHHEYELVFSTLPHSLTHLAPMGPWGCAPTGLWAMELCGSGCPPDKAHLQTDCPLNLFFPSLPHGLLEGLQGQIFLLKAGPTWPGRRGGRVVIMRNFGGIQFLRGVRWSLNPSSLGFSIYSALLGTSGSQPLQNQFSLWIIPIEEEISKAKILGALMFAHTDFKCGVWLWGSHFCGVDSLSPFCWRQSGSEAAQMKGSTRLVCHLL